MPSATGTKRVRVSIQRNQRREPRLTQKPSGSLNLSTICAVFGSEAQPFDPATKPSDVSSDHTHQWRVYVRGVNGEDISYWIKKVQFKLHETYVQNVRTIEHPPYEVTETGWGEFEIQIKIYFVPESMEKPQTLWHPLKLHPYGPDAEGKKERREVVVSQNYEEAVFNEPVEQFYEYLTGGSGAQQPHKGKSGKNAKSAQQQRGNGRTAEIPYNETPDNPYSRTAENKELDRLAEATKTVEQLIKDEKERLIAREKRLAELRESEKVTTQPTKKR
ncbi:YEATS domain-containing protein YAF9 [Aspergillus mulundensis]|uniref:Protein AF-9 homolog n=1 Tax=Aspergillus mulundensis TaxID=1810919 RepID=A0A3D8S4J0_9EURO|nr:hypothetical protein DSM5745_04780 [Aspergillus mulundensis]RDW81223.1 hypothetical protein DSM5745_04780 [Aspergillus mulundensis]